MTKEELLRLEPGTQVDVTLQGERSGPYVFVRVRYTTENEELVYVRGESNLHVFTGERISLHSQSTNTTSAGFRKFGPYDRVEKIKGSSWRGKVVGFYSTSLTPEGYAVESQYEPGSVQLYPAEALKLQGEK